MARLIDADKLMESLNPKESVWVGLVLAEQVANAETVEAIPVEWIKGKVEQYETERAELLSKMWEVYGDKKVYIGSLSVKDTCRTHELRFKTYYYNDLLEQWEKENENRVE